MKATGVELKRALYLTITVLGALLFEVAWYPAFAECDKCSIPEVLQFDFSVNVPKPAQVGDDLFEWMKLFLVADFANGELFNKNQMCVAFSDGDFKATGHHRLANFQAFPPPPGKITSGDYLTTGEISKTGSGYQMTMNLETTCSRQTVLSSTGIFTISRETKIPDSEYARELLSNWDKYAEGESDPPPIPEELIGSDWNNQVEQIVRDNFVPLLPKIREFERKMRDTDTRIAIDATHDDSLVMNPEKHHVRPNETVPITITLKDCDDEPLRNRVISLMPSSKWGVEPSQNGRFNTTTATTDNSGKVTVNYKVGTYPGVSTARAFFEYLMPSGCEMAGYNETVINVDGARQYHGKAMFTSPVAETTGVAEVTWTLIDKHQEKNENAVGDDYSGDEDEDTNDEEGYSDEDTSDDELEYVATGTIKGVVKVPDCDPLQVEIPIKSGDGELAVNYSEKTYRFEFSSDTEITLMCGKPRRPWVISGASVFHYTGGLCAEPAGIGEGSSPEEVINAISGMKLGVPYDDLKTFKGVETCNTGMFGTTRWNFEAVM